jgi:Family of unknown function (DUF6326)
MISNRPDFQEEGRRLTTEKRAILALEDIKINVKFKLFALWSSVMFFYIYGDYFELYQPGKLQEMIAGRMALGVTTQGVLLGMAALMAIPSLMVFLSLLLPPPVNRWMNIIFGVVYTLVMILAIKGAWHFYVFFGLVEITLTALIVWYAWTWPKQPAR